MVIGWTWTKSLESFNVKAKADGGYYEANAILMVLKNLVLEAILIFHLSFNVV
jgi:hypothetical protein